MQLKRKIISEEGEMSENYMKVALPQYLFFQFILTWIF